MLDTTSTRLKCSFFSLTRNEDRFDSMIYVGFSVQHIMSHSGFIVSAIIDTLQLLTMKQCFEGNRSLWHVRLVFSIHNKDRSRKRTTLLRELLSSVFGRKILDLKW